MEFSSQQARLTRSCIGSLGVSDPPELNGSLCASVAQFSLHANVYCGPEQRDKLEKLCRYVARPAVAEERLKLKGNGDVLLRLKKPYSDGTSHLVFSPHGRRGPPRTSCIRSP